MQLIVSCPINNLSFGNVSYNFLREIWRKNIDAAIFPIGGNVDISAFDKIDKKFAEWLQNAINSRFKKLNPKTPTFKMWHINGAETRHTEQQFLYTFYELDNPTETETAIVNSQAHTIFSSNYAANSFKDFGCENVSSVSLGFDEDFYETKRDYMPDKIHFGLVGKFEKRKATGEILRLWAKKYGDNQKYQLTCLIENPFIKKEDMNKILANVFQGKKYSNINIIPRLKTNSEMNEVFNAIDIDLGGLSRAEGFNLPSFNCTALGKWSIVLNASSHKDWATKENSILIQPNGKQPAADGMFFSGDPNVPFNRGNIYSWDEEEVVSAMEFAETKAKTYNSEGAKLVEKFTYKNSVENILKIIF